MHAHEDTMKRIPRSYSQRLHEDFVSTSHRYHKKIRKYALYNLVQEMCINIKMDAESNETTPAISIPLSHEDSYIYIRIYV